MSALSADLTSSYVLLPCFRARNSPNESEKFCLAWGLLHCLDLLDVVAAMQAKYPLVLSGCRGLPVRGHGSACQRAWVCLCMQPGSSPLGGYHPDQQSRPRQHRWLTLGFLFNCPRQVLPLIDSSVRLDDIAVHTANVLQRHCRLALPPDNATQCSWLQGRMQKPTQHRTLQDSVSRHVSHV